MGIKILGTGSFLPEKIVSNEDIARKLDTTDEWIYSHTGIRSRHVASEGESTSTSRSPRHGNGRREPR